MTDQVTSTPPGGEVLPPPDEIETCIALSCEQCDFTAVCHDYIAPEELCQHFDKPLEWCLEHCPFGTGSCDRTLQK